MISELRVERLKYQASSNDKNGEEERTVYSNFQKTDRDPNNDKHHLSHRATPSIYNNFTESAVS